MLFSWKWLGDYVDLPDDVHEGARELTAAGFAVELIDEVGDDHVLDIDVTTNRPDCMNHRGLAREIAVIRDAELRTPDTTAETLAEAASSAITIEIADPDLCHRYVGKVVRDVEIGASPAWLVERIEAIGLRSINNVVDITNFVLWETGQPLHAFDLDRLGGAKIVVRRARAGETLRTLDGELRDLDSEMLVIADASEPVAIAGVMGGADSEVDDATTDVLIESAYFDPTSVRRAARRLAMHTDASHRFERGCDPQICLYAAERAAALLAELARGKVLAGAVDAYPRPWQPPTITLDPERVSAFAGLAIDAADCERWLRGLGCEMDTSAGEWEVLPASWRGDLELTADLYEEVLRLRGFDDIPATLPTVTGSDGPRTPRQQLRRRLRSVLCGAGFAEAINYAFIDRESDASWPSPMEDAAPLELSNPLSDRYSVMRRSLLPGLHSTAEFNRRRGASLVRVFEVGNVFAEGQRERETLAIVTGGSPGTPWDRREMLDFFDLKGVIEALADACGKSFGAAPAELSSLQAGVAAELFLDAKRFGVIGQIEGSDGLGYPLFAAEIEIAGLEGRPVLETEAPPRFPGISTDFTLTHSLDHDWHSIDAMICENRPENLEDWDLQVRYRGKGVPEGFVNTTIRFRYVSAAGSLTQDEVNQQQERLTDLLTAAFGRN